MFNLIIFPLFFFFYYDIYIYVLIIYCWYFSNDIWGECKKKKKVNTVVKWQLRRENGSSRFVFKLQARRPPKSPVRNENNIVTTDHRPYKTTDAEKTLTSFWNGASGIQTALPLNDNFYMSTRTTSRNYYWLLLN